MFYFFFSAKQLNHLETAWNKFLRVFVSVVEDDFMVVVAMFLVGILVWDSSEKKFSSTTRFTFFSDKQLSV